MRLAPSIITAFAMCSLSACGGKETKQSAFFDQLSSLCGQAFPGKLISDKGGDSAWAEEEMVIHVRDCAEDELRIPFHVGENRSRTWIISKEKRHLGLAHDHRHDDGTPETITYYGGETVEEGSIIRQEFPANEFTKMLFTTEGLEVSTQNVWALEILTGEYLAYELVRPNREFRVEFDLTNPVDIPPPAWDQDLDFY